MKIAVVGSYGVGLTMRVPRFPAAGETVSGGTFVSEHGGKGSNQAVGAARLGAEVALLTAVGDDANGRAAAELWAAEGVDAQHVVVTDTATMVGFIEVEPGGENRIAIAPGALDCLDDTSVEPFRGTIAGADVVVVSMEIPRAAVGATLRIGRENRVLTLLNPAPARPLPDDMWENIDVITPNQTEAPALLGLGPDHGLDDVALAAALQERTGGAVILTRGGHGALIADAAGTRPVPPRPVSNVVDTTGAGDSFTAALAVALAGGASLDAAAEYAARAGAHAVSIAGVIPAMPRPSDLAVTPQTQIGATR
ncbi:ribokinase [Leucobacter luti]|uniref:Ribokinase n=1 Tax=Leucobacter luti TaxID=340320 RepID=A0A4Q7TPU8_9MICO|nr:ribokinase [Leucobacter luti]MBL3699880.1 ribokinase [Leucobacter luti]RZT62801.1 ribokinase [Leucobacter luti]